MRIGVLMFDYRDLTDSQHTYIECGGGGGSNNNINTPNQYQYAD